MYRRMDRRSSEPARGRAGDVTGDGDVIGDSPVTDAARAEAGEPSTKPPGEPAAGLSLSDTRDGNVAVLVTF